jgi:hypothetical protein
MAFNLALSIYLPLFVCSAIITTPPDIVIEVHVSYQPVSVFVLVSLLFNKATLSLVEIG